MFLKRITAAITLLIAAGVAAVAPASAAAALPEHACNIICDGQNPNGASWFDENGVGHPCDDFRTIYTITAGSGQYAELRYSRECRMAWARGFIYTGGSVWVEGFNPDGRLRDGAVFEIARDRTSHSLAVNDAGNTARVCLWLAGPAPGGPICGRRY
jgi:hypothetical protein